MGLLTLIPAGYRLFALGLAALAIFAAGWFRGNEHGTRKLTEYIGKQAVEAVRVVTKRGEATERVRIEYVKVAGKTKVVTETVEKEVVRYADSHPGTCLDPLWRVLHDRAAANAVPAPARGADGPGRAASGAAPGRSGAHGR